MKTVKFYTLGCKVNQYDTQSIREKFLRYGFKELFNGRKADLCLINTCTVTHRAEADSLKFVRKAQSENPQAKIVVTGCLADKNNLSLGGIKGIDFIINKRFFTDGISRFCGHTRAFLKIQDGCNNLCSYCKVPLVRGSSRSRGLNEIILEARRLVENGFKEIVLTGICLGSYGKDLRPKIALVDLIRALEDIDCLLRIRLSSIEAGDVSAQLIRSIAQSKKMCRHLHIPIQSGDNEILKKMNRRYSRKDYLSLIDKLRNLIPDIAITTDCLVGFPGEREENFRNTIKLIKEVLPLRTHIFPYSQRQGTAAAGFACCINAKVIKERAGRLKEAAEACSLEYKSRFINKSLPVLFEGRVKDNPGLWEGYSDNYIKVAVNSGLALGNLLMPVKFKKIAKDHVQAILIDR